MAEMKKIDLGLTATETDLECFLGQLFAHLSVVQVETAVVKAREPRTGTGPLNTYVRNVLFRVGATPPPTNAFWDYFPTITSVRAVGTPITPLVFDEPPLPSPAPVEVPKSDGPAAAASFAAALKDAAWFGSVRYDPYTGKLIVTLKGDNANTSGLPIVPGFGTVYLPPGVDGNGLAGRDSFHKRYASCPDYISTDWDPVRQKLVCKVTGPSRSDTTERGFVVEWVHADRKPETAPAAKKEPEAPKKKYDPNEKVADPVELLSRFSCDYGSEPWFASVRYDETFRVPVVELRPERTGRRPEPAPAPTGFPSTFGGRPVAYLHAGDDKEGGRTAAQYRNSFGERTWFLSADWDPLLAVLRVRTNNDWKWDAGERVGGYAGVTRVLERVSSGPAAAEAYTKDNGTDPNFRYCFWDDNRGSLVAVYEKSPPAATAFLKYGIVYWDPRRADLEKLANDYRAAHDEKPWFGSVEVDDNGNRLRVRYKPGRGMTPSDGKTADWRTGTLVYEEINDGSAFVEAYTKYNGKAAWFRSAVWDPKDKVVVVEVERGQGFDNAPPTQRFRVDGVQYTSRNVLVGPFPPSEDAKKEVIDLHARNNADKTWFGGMVWDEKTATFRITHYTARSVGKSLPSSNTNLTSKGRHYTVAYDTAEHPDDVKARVEKEKEEAEAKKRRERLDFLTAAAAEYANDQKDGPWFVSATAHPESDTVRVSLRRGKGFDSAPVTVGAGGFYINWNGKSAEYRVTYEFVEEKPAGEPEPAPVVDPHQSKYDHYAKVSCIPAVERVSVKWDETSATVRVVFAKNSLYSHLVGERSYWRTPGGEEYVTTYSVEKESAPADAEPTELQKRFVARYLEGNSRSKETWLAGADWHRASSTVRAKVRRGSFPNAPTPGTSYGYFLDGVQFYTSYEYVD